MLGAGSTSSPASGRILTVFEEEILAQVEKCRRWNVIDGRSYIVYGISEEGLKKFIPDGVLNSFKCFEEFAIRALDCHEPEKTRLCCKKLFHRDFVDASSVSGISLQNDEECEAFTILSDDSKRKTSEVLVGVNDRSSIVAGKKMIITNTSEQCVSPFSNDKGVLFKSRLGGKYIWLKCSESVLLNFDVENGKRIWKEIGKSMTHNVYFDVNPLSRQSGPVFQYTGGGKSLGINHERDGELFLPLHVIDTLLQRKIYSGNQKFVQWVCTNCDFQMKALFEIARITAEENNEGVLVCMVYEHLPVHHTLASTLYIKGGILYFYLHETLGFENELAIKIRDKQLAALKSSFYNYSIVCITPKEPMQKDFSVCGVFAINMARYVSKNPLGWVSFLVNQKIKNPCFGEVAIEYIPVKSLPPELLKVCQRVEHISPDNKRTLIGHKNKWDLTLGEYLTAYGGKHAALVKLIKYINEYAAIRRDSQPAKSNIAPVMEDRSGKRSKRKRCQIVESSSGDLSEPKPKRERTLKINDRLSGQNLFVKLEST